MKHDSMTVRELIDKFSTHPDTMIVLATWEGVHTKFKPENFEVEGNFLIIDVDQD